MTYCYLALGSNLKTPARQLRQALLSLRTLPRTMLLKCSPIYFSKPDKDRLQPSYCNAVIKIDTTLAPNELLRYCRLIEQQHQRTRKNIGDARTLDIDVLLYGNKTIISKSLIIPHPRFLERDFVLVPLLKIAPDVTLPNGKKVAEQKRVCKRYII